MFDSRFQTGSPVHLLSLAVCILCVACYGFIGRRARDRGQSWVAKSLACACVLAWIANAWMALSPEFFKWETSLPLYYCNWANLLGASAILWRFRVIDALLYYWACGLSVWAFVTPTLVYGPAHIGFWVFWAYHLCIALAVCHLLVVQRFRPGIKDWLAASAVTIAYGLILVPVNLCWNWNYAFLGKGSPKVATPIDALGAWPMRLVWLALLAVLLFYLLTVPWLLRKRAKGSHEESLLPEN